MSHVKRRSLQAPTPAQLQAYSRSRYTSRLDGICRSYTLVRLERQSSQSSAVCVVFNSGFITKMEDNTDKFINTVRLFKPLWDMKDKRYHSRDIQRNLWAKVAQELGEEVAELKRRWKGLRDAFRREYKKLLKSGQEAPDEFESSWPFFDQMLFLRDVMEPRQLKGNIPLPVKHTETETVSEDAIEEDLELESEKDDSFLENSNSNSAVHHSEPHLAPTALQTMGPPLTTPTKRKPTRLDIDRKNRDRGSPGKSSSNKTKRSVDVSDTHFLEIEKAKLKLLETSASSKNDSEYQFLVSLLPYLKNIPASRQLQVRNKLQQVLIDEQERNSFVAINYKDPLPSTVNQSPGHSSWSNSAYTGCSSDTTSESSWDVTPVNSPLQSFITNFK